MSFDLGGLQAAVARHGRVVRVVIADVQGSSPREVGAAMLVWDSETGAGQSGTIGGGALEFQAAEAARRQTQTSVLSRHALGPALGQCCGGSVVLLSEIHDAGSLPSEKDGVFARPANGPANGPTQSPLPVRRLLAEARRQGTKPAPRLLEGWMVEPVLSPSRPIWIWGAGHVGRALVDVMAPLPDLALTWVDTAPDRFPGRIPDAVTPVPVARPADLVRHAPPEAEHLVLTYSHALDLELCHRLLDHDFAFAGLIGSATKWARFRSRLAALGHRSHQIGRITCPIGDPALGKHPQAIAVGVAATLLAPAIRTETRKDGRA